MSSANAMVKLVLLGVVMTLVGVANSDAQSRENSGYESFKLMRSRNIFDPNRLAPRPEPSRDRQQSGPPRSRSLSLTGTMVTDGKVLAFFGGSRGDGKVLGVGEKISDFAIKTIAPLQVELEKDGKVTTLVVGKQIAVEGGGSGVDEPAPVEEHPAPAPAPGPAAPASSEKPANGGGGTNDKNEIMRRMMERRQQQMSK